MARPAKATIDLNALRHNYQVAKELAGGGRVIAIVKADAYSHGAVSCAQVLSPVADGFAVSCMEEALELRTAGIENPILLLEGIFEASELALVDQFKLDMVVHSDYQVQALVNFNSVKPLRIWLKMDSGMGRAGFASAIYADVYKALSALPAVGEIVMMSHFARADEKNNALTQQQLETFQQATEGLQGDISLCNSAALMDVELARGHWNRPGLLIYGVSPFMDLHQRAKDLVPVMSLESKLISVKTVPQGSQVGYGGRWVTQRETRLGVVAMGYADGYPRHAKNGTPVLVNGVRVPLVGNVSMDMLTVDLTDLAEAAVGDNVELWGKNLSIAEVAQHADTIPYQLMCNLNRVPVEYVGLQTVFNEAETVESNK